MNFKAPLAAVCTLSLLALLVAGCPPAAPPFDASGNYEGTWSGTVTTEEKITLNITDCPLSIELGQDVDFPFLNFHVIGRMTVNWGCLLPPEIIESLNLEPTDVTLPMLAVMDADGGLTLSVTVDTTTIDPALLALLGIQSGTVDVPLQNLNFELDANGVDENLDGMMDRLAGTLSLSANFDDDGVQKAVTVSGTFSVDAV